MSHDTAHQLCTLCQNLSFELHETLHGAESCPIPGCEANTLHLSSSLHSPPTPHYQSLDVLEESAAKGCHLCCLLSAGLRSASRIRTKLSTLTSGIVLYFGCDTTSPAWDEVSENITAIYGDAVACFQVVALPDSQCSDPAFVDFNHDRAIKFRTACLVNEDLEETSFRVIAAQVRECTLQIQREGGLQCNSTTMYSKLVATNGLYVFGIQLSLLAPIRKIWDGQIRNVSQNAHFQFI